MRLPNRLAAATLAGCVVAAVMAVTVSAAPNYLLTKRAGQSFQYEARYDAANTSDYDQLLRNESLASYPYVFTADMNVLIKDIFATNVMGPLASNLSLTDFNECDKLPTSSELEVAFRSKGCYKTALHAGIASDCRAVNPLCCVQYWRYPASLPDRLPTSEIDRRLIFWDGTQAANGFFTNFSDAYRSRYPNCSYFEVGPSPYTYATPANSSLAVDASGEWRFVGSGSPIYSLVEVLMYTINATEERDIALLRTMGASVWSSSQRFGNIPLVATVIVVVSFTTLLLMMLLFMYLCADLPAKKEKARVRSLIKGMEKEAARSQASLSRRSSRRRRRRQSSSGDSSIDCSDSPQRSPGRRSNSKSPET